MPTDKPDSPTKEPIVWGIGARQVYVNFTASIEDNNSPIIKYILQTRYVPEDGPVPR